MSEGDNKRGCVVDTSQGGLPSVLLRLKERRAKLLANRSKSPDDSKLKEHINIKHNANGISDLKATNPSNLDKKIIRQVEYYYGDYNLPKDRFLQQLISDDPDGWVSIETMLTFKRLADLSHDAELIMEALCKSDSGLMEVDFSLRKIRRKPNKALPEMTESRKLQIEERTLFISGFKKETTLDEILEYFENQIEGVSNVRMRYQREERPKESGDMNKATDIEEDLKDLSIFVKRDEPDNRKFLGSVFVTFNTNELAKDFLKTTEAKKGEARDGTMLFNGQKLKVITLKQFHQKRVENNDQFLPDKIRRNVYVQGFDKVDTSEEELVKYFGQFGGAESVRKRVYRSNSSEDDKEGEWRFTGSVFVTFETEKHAKIFLENAKNGESGLKYGNDRLNAKWQSEFYEERGKFKREISKLKEGVDK